MKSERQHHAADLVGAERVDRDRRAQRGIDAAGDAEQYAGKSVLADVVAQAQHTGRVIALVALDQRHDRPGTAPAVGALGPVQRDDALLEGGQLRRDRKIGVERERRAVEHQFVLSADLVEIDQRQAALGDASDRDRQPEIVLVARVGRAVRHHQNFRAGLGEAFDDVFVFLGLFEPDVLADGNADPDALDRHRTRGGTAREQAFFVEHAVIRQIRLEAKRDAALIEQRAGIIELAVFDPGRADQHRGPTARGLARQFLDGGAAGGLERGLQHQVFRRVAADEQFRQHQQIGAVGLGLVTRGARLGGIAGDIADRRVQLRQRDLEGFGHGSDGALHKSKLQMLALERAYAFGDGKQPECPGHQAARRRPPPNPCP